MRIAKTIGGSILLLLLLLAAFEARAVVLWSSYDSITVHENGPGTDLLGGALKRGDDANDTLYFKFRVEPISDETTEPYFAALELLEDDTERLGVGNALEAWAYSVFFPGAQSSGVPPAGYLDLHSAHPDANALAHQAKYQCPRRGEPAVIVFKIQYIPHSDAMVTVWLNPDLGPGGNEINQPDALTTRFHAKATFDELRLRHGGKGGGWTFSDVEIATTFNDFVDSSSDRPGTGGANLLESEGSLQFQSWLRNQGLSQLPVRALQQTKDGYLWIAGASEIERFDGLKFVPLNVRVAGTNYSKPTIFADSQGALWFAAPGGLQRVQKSRLTTLTTDEGLPSSRIMALNEDAQQNIWIGTAAGLVIWNKGRVLPLSGAESIRGRSITAIAKDHQGTIWLVVDEKEIFKFSQGRLVRAATGYSKEWMTNIRGLLLDQADRLWLSMGDGAIVCQDNEGWHRYRLTKRISGSRVNALAEEPDGTIWAGTTGGLFLFSKGKFSAVPASSRLAGNSVESLFV
ncbi:MAG TPA: two-component regulator propeller domain-containing protein, partial [Verrucomicrobiae bacterium]|nr:two-component regulator propeller domain-containing protein [Verrucomicrobiae bacterium]